MDEVARDAITFHDEGEAMKKEETRMKNDGGEAPLLPNKGLYAYRKDGEKHAWNPETISTLQIATRLGSYKKFKEFTRLVDEKEKPIFLRDFLDFRHNPISIDRVEPVESILKRFVTGAMSFGAISQEAHEAMAVAMNKLHGRSNTGEGGEDAAPSELKCAVPSKGSIRTFRGHYGISGECRRNTDKVAQGAKPGEGGQLPDSK